MSVRVLECVCVCMSDSASVSGHLCVSAYVRVYVNACVCGLDSISSQSVYHFLVVVAGGRLTHNYHDTLEPGCLAISHPG